MNQIGDEYYKLRASDFIPIRGFFDYTNRADNPPSIEIAKDLKNLGRGFIVGVYNLVLVGALSIGALKGLEFLINR